MAQYHQRSIRNRLLAALSPDDFDLIEPYLTRVHHALRETLVAEGQTFTRIFFPETSIASLLADSEEGRIEIGMVGREGLVGLPVLLGVSESPFFGMCQSAGDALALDVGVFRQALAQSSTLKDRLLLYVHVMMLQTAQTAFSNAVYPLEARLARWILMIRDRSEGDELTLTHDLLSTMLAVRRPGVTVATQSLEGSGLIRATRGRITVLDREGLETVAGNAYGRAEAEYAARLGTA